MTRALPLVLLLACAHAPAAALAVTGETLDAAGIAFETTAAGMQAASDAHTLTAEQVYAWNDFLARWKAGYPGACALWRAAKSTGDLALAAQAEALIATFLAQLATWQTVAKGAADEPPGGG